MRCVLAVAPHSYEWRADRRWTVMLHLCAFRVTHEKRREGLGPAAKFCAQLLGKAQVRAGGAI